MNEEEKEKRENEIDKLATTGEGLREDNKNKQIPYDFGLCNTCDKFYFIEFEGYGNFKAWCSITYDEKMSRTPKNKVKICSRYWNKGYKTVRELADFAIWLDDKKKVGFNRE